MDRQNIDTEIRDQLEDDETIEQLDDLFSQTEVVLATLTEEETGALREQNIKDHIITVWKVERRENTDNKMKVYRFLSNTIIGILLFLGIYVVADSLGFIEVEEWTLRLIIVSIFGVVASIFTIIVKHMFPEDGDKQFFDFMIRLYTTSDEGINES